MELTNKGLAARSDWENAGYKLPDFDRNAVSAKTKAEPFWIHFGAGNIFRAFQCNAVQNMLNSGAIDKGIIAAEGFDYEIIEKVNRPHDDLSILVTLKANGSVEKTVVASVAESLVLDSDNEREFSRLKEIFRAPSLQMASFTITEKGYSLTGADGNLLPAVKYDMEHGPEKPRSYIGKVVSLLYERYLADKAAIAMVSMDNCSHNGDKLYAAVSAFSKAWADNGLAEREFAVYTDSPSSVSFPWTMIDKITPRPDPSVQEILKADGVDAEPVITSMHTYTAPFVNAEECEYLVIEDAFPNGRPRLEEGGFIFTDRETVDKVEKMKVCTCLNPLHTALAVFGCLLGYKLISEEMKDPALKKLAEGIGYNEGLPVVVDPGIISPEKFINEVLNVRIPNPFMPDTPQRIATDTSQKLAIRFGETIKAYQASDALDTASLKLIPLVLAGWLRYLTAVDDSGKDFELSPDPMLDALGHMKNIRLGDSVSMDELKELLSNKTVFGVDLFDAGLAELVVKYFNELNASAGAVRKTLEKYV